MDDAELLAILEQQISDAETLDGSDRDARRRKALDYLNGKVPDYTAQPGKSSVVSRDVADAMSWIVPGVKKIFLRSANIAEYLPQTQKDEPFAKQATDYVNYVIKRECNGYAEFSTAIHEGLLLGNGVLKHWWDKSKEECVETYTRLDDEALSVILFDLDETAEVSDFEQYEDDEYEGPEGAPKPSLYDLKVKYTKSRGRLRFEAVADEDFLIERNARALTERECRFCAHRGRPTRSELIEQGHPKAKVDAIPTITEESNAADRSGKSLLRGETISHKPSERVKIYECYLLVDYDGDGIAERRKIVTGGTGSSRQILANEEWGDDLPFSDLVPDPKPFTWQGRSIFDDTEEVQQVKTVLQRKMLDNLYNVVEPQVAVDADKIEDVSSVTNRVPGGVIVVTGDPNAAIRELTTPFVGKEAFAMLEYQDMVAERRTGVGANSQGLDQDALQNQTARAVEATQSAQATKKEDYADNIAEVGMKRFYKCVLKLIVKNQDKPRTVQLRKKEWVTVDPRPWNVDMDVEVNTGLGTGTRDKDLQVLNGIAAKQEQSISVLGPTNEILGIDHLFATYRKMAEAAGIKSPESFFPEVTEEMKAKLAQSMNKPDPKMMEAQQKIQIEQQKAQADHQLAQQKAMAELENNRANGQLKIQLAREELSLIHI